MRRQIQLDDFEITETCNVSACGSNGQKSTACNTDQFIMKDVTIQTLIRNSNKDDFGIQVNEHAYLIQSRVENVGNRQNGQQTSQQMQDQQTRNDVNQTIVEPQQKTKKLLKFLRKIVPLMEEQLNEDLPIYQKFGKENAKIWFKRQSKLLITLQNLDTTSQQKLQISDIAWNATGVILGAVYSKPNHEGTCSHKSMICLWGLFKRNVKTTRPETITTSNCINCISFHPKKPSVFVCGSYTGEVLLYDYSKQEEQLIAKTIIDDYFHRDIITKIIWWAFRPSGKAETHYNILSLATDGKILLWQVLNQAITEEGSQIKSKMLLKYPIKGFLMLRRKQGEIIPVSGLTMNQSKINKNFFIVGSEGGSILRATLSPINHYVNSQSKVVLDVQQTIKFKNSVYPFLLNIVSKNLPQIKNHIEKYCIKNKIKEVQNLSIVFQSLPEIGKLYPNPISFAYEAFSFPISSISDNKYGLFIANAYEGCSRIYLQSMKTHLQSIQQGYEWGWINGTHLLAGFIQQQWVVVDWTTNTIVWSIGVGEGKLWREHGRQIAVVCQKTKVKVIQIGDKIIAEAENRQQEVLKKIQELKTQ